MATQIENNGASLKITSDGNPRFVMKSQIIEVEVLRDTIIKIDIGKGALFNYFADQTDVTLPVSADVNDLRDQIVAMLQSPASVGLATELKQTEQTAELLNVKNVVTEMKDKVSNLNDKLFFEPRITDETNPNAVYKGYALAGATIDAPVWAIQLTTNNKGVLTTLWAGGTKDFTQIWNNRKTLVYN